MRIKQEIMDFVRLFFCIVCRLWGDSCLLGGGFWGSIAEKDWFVQKKAQEIFLRRLLCCIQHIFNEDSISPGGIIHQHVSDSTNKFPILNNGTSAHARVNIGPTHFGARIF